MKVNVVGAAIISAIVVSAVLAGMSWIMDGDPKLYRSVPMGVVIGVVNVSVMHWMSKKNKATQQD